MTIKIAKPAASLAGTKTAAVSRPLTAALKCLTCSVADWGSAAVVDLASDNGQCRCGWRGRVYADRNAVPAKFNGAAPTTRGQEAADDFERWLRRATGDSMRYRLGDPGLTKARRSAIERRLDAYDRNAERYHGLNCYCVGCSQ